MRPAGTAVLLLLLGLSPAAAEGLEWALRAETGFFNRAFQDRQYITATTTSFGVPYGAFGAEIGHRDDDGNLWAVGVAQTTIGAGRQFNWDQWEVQPLTLMNFAAVSMGKDFGWWEFGAGVGALVQLEDFEAASYWSSDGTPGPGRPGGLDWNRRESFTLVTGLLRVFERTGPHLAVRVARGPLSLTENLFHVQGLWPLGASQLDAELGFSSPMGLLSSGEGVLRGNERLTVGWSFGDSGARIGVRAGVLLRTIIAGSGEVDFFRRFSLGLDWSMSSGSF